MSSHPPWRTPDPVTLGRENGRACVTGTRLDRWPGVTPEGAPCSSSSRGAEDERSRSPGRVLCRREPVAGCVPPGGRGTTGVPLARGCGRVLVCRTPDRPAVRRIVRLRSAVPGRRGPAAGRGAAGGRGERAGRRAAGRGLARRRGIADDGRGCRRAL